MKGNQQFNKRQKYDINFSIFENLVTKMNNITKFF